MHLVLGRFLACSFVAGTDTSVGADTAALARARMAKRWLGLKCMFVCFDEVAIWEGDQGAGFRSVRYWMEERTELDKERGSMD